MSIYQDWLSAKRAEAEAVARRRAIEDQIAAELGVDATHEGSKTHKLPGYKVRVTTRMSRRIDSERLQEIAAEHGTSQHLSGLFRWKPEINSRAWKAADKSITGPLLAAITTTPGRPSFAIEPNEE